MFIIQPYYTGRDKGPIRKDGEVATFRTEGEAWYYVFTVVQPNDCRAQHNYRVIPA